MKNDEFRPKGLTTLSQAARRYQETQVESPKVVRSTHLIITVPINMTMDEFGDLVREAEESIPAGYVFSASWRVDDDLYIRFSPAR